MSTNPHDVERRLKTRQKLREFLPGFILAVNPRRPVPAILADVSSSGLGILTDRPLPTNSSLILVTLKGEIELKVMWCESHDSGFKTGLAVSDPAINLIDLFSAFWQRSA